MEHTPKSMTHYFCRYHTEFGGKNNCCECHPDQFCSNLDPAITPPPMSKPKPTKQKGKTVKAWADVGSHEGIFEFVGGRIADDYPNLMHVYSKPQPGLREVSITILPLKPTKQ